MRAVEPAEHRAVGELIVAAYRALPVDHLWGGYDAEILDTAGRVASTDVLVAVDGNDRVLGSVTWVTDASSPWYEFVEPGFVQFRLLAVAPDAQRSGAGRALVGACVARAEQLALPIAIHTTRWMDAARRLYDRFGFVRRPDLDVPYEAWHEAGVDLPSEWIGEPFLAYTWTPGTDSSRRPPAV